MKKFDLELAKEGHKVQTRDGRTVRILCWDLKSTDSTTIGALVKTGTWERWHSYYDNGISPDDSNLDLFMTPTKKSGWVNLYATDDNTERYTGSRIYSDKEQAKGSHSGRNYLTVAKIEWEE